MLSAMPVSRFDGRCGLRAIQTTSKARTATATPIVTHQTQGSRSRDSVAAGSIEVTRASLPMGERAGRHETPHPYPSRMASMLDDLTLLTTLHRQVVEESGRTDLLALTDELERRCRTEDPQSPAELVGGLDPDTTERIARLLTVRLHLTNLAEERQRARSLRSEDGEYGGGADTGDITPAVRAAGADARRRIERMRIHPVLTAHPTEARRRAVASSLRRIADHLDRHDDPGSGPSE